MPILLVDCGYLRRETMSDFYPGLMTIFGEALEQSDPAARAAYLDRACGADTALRQRVEALLAAHAGAGRFLEADIPYDWWVNLVVGSVIVAIGALLAAHAGAGWLAFPNPV